MYGATKHGLYTRMQVMLNDPVFQNLISNTTTLKLKELINQKKVILFIQLVMMRAIQMAMIQGILRVIDQGILKEKQKVLKKVITKV